MTAQRDDVLALADDKLMLGHVQSDWTGLGPILEEDIAASAMAQDDLSHALVLYEYLGEDPDLLAFGREPAAYRCCDLVTLPDEFDWATATARRFVMAMFAQVMLEDFAEADDDDLAERAARLLKEQAIQVAHLNNWIVRLGCGGDDAAGRMQAAFDLIAPHTGMLFEALADGHARFDRWWALVNPVVQQAGIAFTVALPDAETIGGRRGEHADHFLSQHDEMTQVRAIEPDAAW